MKDQLYLLKPGFKNAGLGPLYCSDSTPIEGMLSFFPKLREVIDVHYLEFPRPRAALVSLLGEHHQSLPVLVLAEGRKVKDKNMKPVTIEGHRVFADERSIRSYLSAQYDFPQAS
jgi:hypothetical protein